MAGASVRDVARLAAVSVGTVSHVINHPERVSPDARARVEDAIAQLGYVRNDAARQLRVGRSATVGFVVPDVRNPFFTDVARGAEDEGALTGLALLLGNAGEDVTRERAYLDLFEQQRVRGVLISPYGHVTPALERLGDRGIRSVLVDGSDDTGRISSVSVDDVTGGRLAAEHLLGRGRRRIAFVGGTERIRQVRDRLAGARGAVDAVRRAALEVVPTEALSVLEGRRIGAELAARPQSARPDAVFAANDLLAIGVLQALILTRSTRVPDDVALVGYDDIGFAASAMVPLTSVRQPSEQIGRSALRMLAEESDDASLAPRQVRFEPEIVIRESSG